MLREIPSTRQIPAEPRRRWFFSHQQDLVVWYDAHDNIVSFQLAYNKYREERSIYWQAGKGFSHHDVDDGEQTPFRSDTPLLTVDGAFDHAQVLKEFLEIAQDLPEEIISFVENHLKQYTAA